LQPLLGFQLGSFNGAHDELLLLPPFRFLELDVCLDVVVNVDKEGFVKVGREVVNYFEGQLLGFGS